MITIQMNDLYQVRGLWELSGIVEDYLYEILYHSWHSMQPFMLEKTEDFLLSFSHLSYM